MAYSETWEEYKRIAKEYPMENLLEHLGYTIDKYRMILCPFHNDSNRSAQVGTRENIIHCHGCGVNKDTINTYMQITGADFRTAVNDINAMMGNTYTPSQEIRDQVEKAKAIRIKLENEAKLKKEREDHEPPEVKYQKFLGWFSPYNTLKRIPREKVDEYLKSKCLEGSVEILNKNKLDIGLDRQGHICYRLNGFGIVIMPEIKMNMGSPEPTLVVVEKENPLWYVCEGMSDALTAAKLGYNAISIHSVNNIDKLKAKLMQSNNAKKFTYVIAMDNDEAGIKAKNDLISFFTSNSINCSANSIMDYALDGEDLNAMYVRENKGIV